MGALIIAAVALETTTIVATADSPDAALLHWLSSAGAIGILAFIVFALLKGWLVTGRTFERVLAERNRLLELALTSTRAADRAVTIAHEDREMARRVAGTDRDPE